MNSYVTWGELLALYAGALVGQVLAAFLRGSWQRRKWRREFAQATKNSRMAWLPNDARSECPGLDDCHVSDDDPRPPRTEP